MSAKGNAKVVRSSYRCKVTACLLRMAGTTRAYIVGAYLWAGLLAACASHETLDEGLRSSDATVGTAGTSTGAGRGGGSGSGGSGGSGAGAGGGTGGTAGSDTGGSAGTGASGGAPVDASAGRAGFSGAADRDASVGETSPIDAPRRDASLDEASVSDGGDAHVFEGGTIEDGEAGTCGPTFCFDVFECWILFPQCGYTVCELFTCKK
jgi:hypothetical protein